METTTNNDSNTGVIRVPIRNFLKVRVLLYLCFIYKEAIEHGSGGSSAWASVPEISWATQTGMSSLHVILPRWAAADWGYVDSYRFTGEQMEDNRPHTLYKINSKGLSYVNRLDKWYKYRAEAEKILDTADPYPGPDIKRIGWPAFPGASDILHGVSISWPFTSSADTAPACGGRVIMTADHKAAIAASESIFGITPSPACINAALQWQKHIAEQKGFKVKMKNAG